MDTAELTALEHSRRSSAGWARFEVALLLDRDLAAAHAALRACAANELAAAPRWIEPGNAGQSPCGYAETAAIVILAEPATARRLEVLRPGVDPALLAVPWRDCPPPRARVAMATMHYLLDDEPAAARLMVKTRPLGVQDELTARVVSLVIRGRGAEVGVALSVAAAPYAAAMKGGLWRREPRAFTHVQLMAVLRVAAERGQLDLAALPDPIEYAPVAFVRHLCGLGPAAAPTSSSG